MTGSEIARGGYTNEDEIVYKFNNWRNDEDARKWLDIMMYNTEDILEVNAERIGQRGFKSDINVNINLSIIQRKKKREISSSENIQVKLVSTKSGFNQVEKKKVDQYVDLWHIPKEVANILKHYDGEIKPCRTDIKNPKRMFANEFTLDEQAVVLDFLQKHIVMIVSDVIRGRGRYAAEWTLVVNKYQGGYEWILISINEAIGIYLGDCKAMITPKGSFRLGNVTLQRKGGDNGADTANMLQFKTDPMILFNEETRAYSSQA